MVRDFITLASTPIEEECAQVGSDNYQLLARIECRAFLTQIRRTFGVEPMGASLAIKSFPHDFGSYQEVVCYYDDNIEEAVNYAYHIENNLPDKWDEHSHLYIRDEKAKVRL